MKHTTIYLFVTLFFTGWFVPTESCKAQTPIPYQSVFYEHDARGNRVVRFVYIPKRGEEYRDDEPKIAVDVFPNPAQDYLTIAAEDGLQDSVTVRLQVLTSDGRLAETFELAPGENHRLDLSGYPNGLYFLKPQNKQYQSLGSSSFVVLK